MAKPGMGDLLKQAQKMQEKLQKVQDQLADLTVEGSAGGGMVTAVANGKQEIVEIHIDKQVVDPDDVEMLEDLVVAAVNQALEKAQEMASQEMGKAAGGMLPGGMKIPGL
ncbi:YbaB/EbfC family nucleoid-associated protein [candidate division KSB1 bacterium]|nr:YbaB/EbfC family nucleoid-associated protein [candidate division KSB1 bacterium]NIR69598.1 YbaB/EbfC family nucleoid-associated protein [candidate division KSB1 bacterium]NIS24315.1 YbaB/EbfC family nucleoid-associated protein [candidate division KSB1 bacterium]NIT71243.1 YbaB/EbfC family nucleoid-associated protein [candidate division KSB1 bacterium]NIU24947.1 YbaB/EbfC family nucleoid-associated protein [candidate division KSB1 bacterium]